MKVVYDVDKDSWVVQSIQFNYIFNPIPQIKEIPNYNLAYSIQNKSVQNRKDVFVTRKLSGKGLHQSVNITLHLDLLT